MEDIEKIVTKNRTGDPLWLEIQLAVLLGRIDKEEALRRAKGIMRTSKSWQELEAEMYDEPSRSGNSFEGT